ncbi:MAG: ABC transporter [Candidatus Tokpelaia sp. JSC189]|nr:MAG: ABC transporter [Candidatus Tokpelaia sp. JSC189]
MEIKENYVLIGVFTLIVLIFSFLLVYYIARPGEARNLEPLDIWIPGSVTGLSESSPVLFNGIRIGQVRRLILDDTNPNMVIVKTEVNGATLITRSTEATLGFQGLTGLAFIELKGGDLNEPNLLKEAAKYSSVARINADPSTFNNLMVTAQDVFSHVNSALMELEGFIKEVRKPLMQTVKNSQEFTDILKENKSNVNKAIVDIRNVTDRLNRASKNIDRIFSSNDPDNIIVQMRETFSSIRHITEILNHNIRPIAKNLEQFSGKGLRSLESFTSDSRKSIQRIERILVDFEQNPQRIIFGGSGNVPQFDGRMQ